MAISHLNSLIKFKSHSQMLYPSSFVTISDLLKVHQNPVLLTLTLTIK